MRLKYKNTDSAESNIFWITMTDLMTALVLVFIVLFCYAFISNQMENFKQNVAKENLSQALKESLKEQKLSATVDEISGVVKISDLELFNVNSYKLSAKGKAYLDKFAPAYFKSLNENNYLKNNIDKIIIQGHTDSQTYVGKYTKDEQYMKNMELSLKRAFEVANYMTATQYNTQDSDNLRKMIIVEGASFSNPIIINGKEDFSKSRRVELKIVFKQGGERGKIRGKQRIK